ncbi:MAG: hypothetical protein R3E10_13510 [Gemmatimonadota bacterium]
MRMPGSALLFVSWAGLLSGCGAGESASAVAVRDSAGIRIVEHAEDSDSKPVRPTLLLRIEDEALFRVTGAVRLPEGGVVVANGGSSEVRLYDASGALRSTSGGAGEGPGEFRSLNVLRRLEDGTLAVYDSRLRRVQRFDPDGALLGSLTVGETDAPGNVRGIFVDGSLVVRGVTGGGGMPQQGVRRFLAPYSHVSAEGKALAALGSVEGSETLLQVFEGGQGIGLWTPPLPHVVELLPGRQRLFWFDSHQNEFRVTGPDGEDPTWVRRRIPLRDKSDPAWTAAVAEYLSRQAPEQRDFLERELNAWQEGPLPAYSAAHVGNDDVAWLREPDPAVEGQALWSRFDGQGTRLPPMLLPSGFRPLESDATYLVGVSTDDLGTESVEIFALDRLPPEDR